MKNWTLCAPNGMDFSKSIHNPNSRLNRVLTYLRQVGPRTKREILRDVFGKNVGQTKWALVDGKAVNYTPGLVSMGWASYLFSLGVKTGHFQKVRKGNVTYWTAN